MLGRQMPKTVIQGTEGSHATTREANSYCISESRRISVIGSTTEHGYRQQKSSCHSDWPCNTLLELFWSPTPLLHVQSPFVEMTARKFQLETCSSFEFFTKQDFIYRKSHGVLTVNVAMCRGNRSNFHAVSARLGTQGWRKRVPGQISSIARESRACSGLT